MSRSLPHLCQLWFTHHHGLQSILLLFLISPSVSLLRAGNTLLTFQEPSHPGSALLYAQSGHTWVEMCSRSRRMEPPPPPSTSRIRTHGDEGFFALLAEFGVLLFSTVWISCTVCSLC
ncbi:hypothetical protein GE09DRAFT_626271 [Coniochaeta sp. 2T2.1]|nr:hypothetical protein GE09DRAFT_626271 [Coniochaeta sp. 2T2.1]